MIARRSWQAGLGAFALAAAACGTGSTEVVVEEPRPTIFPEAEAPPASTGEVASTSTSATTTVPRADRLPELVDDGVARAVITPTGVVVAVVATTATGWIVHTPCDAEVEISAGTPVSAAHVVLDPGHGGTETGVVGEGGLRESDLNLLVTRLVATELEAMGVAVVMTRTSDQRSTLASRARIASALGADAFVSIHHNADPDGAAARPGTETWYQIDDPESRRLSGLVYEEVAAALSRFGADWVADTDAGAKYRLNQRGTDYYGILRNSAGVPAVLAELAFLSNPTEEALLTTREVQLAEAAAVAAGVVRFLATDDPGSGFVEPYERVEPAGPGGGAAGCEDPVLE